MNRSKSISAEVQIRTDSCSYIVPGLGDFGDRYFTL